MKLALSVNLSSVGNVVEDFTLRATVSDERLQEVTAAYFVERGYEVRCGNCYVLAEKGEEMLYTGFTNYPGGLLVTTIGQ